MLKVLRSLLSPDLPEEWKPKYYIKFFSRDESPLLITHEEYISILPMLNTAKFIIVKGQTYNIAGIDKIVYRYPKENIPPCPQLEVKGHIENNIWIEDPIPESVAKIKRWKELFEQEHNQLMLEGGTYGTEE